MIFRRKKLKIKKKKKYKFKIFSLIILCIIVWVFYLFVVQFENEVVPTAMKISEKYAINIISQEINSAVEDVISNMKLHTNDFFTKNLDKDNNTTYLDVDTILINKVCVKVSEDLSKNLKNISNSKIKLPVGVFSGISLLSDVGPYFSVYVNSIGNTTVDYETNFESVGINQINFQVYLKVEASINIINPMYKKDIDVTRKLMLINTVFNGDVPKTYLNTKY